MLVVIWMMNDILDEEYRVMAEEVIDEVELYAQKVAWTAQTSFDRCMFVIGGRGEHFASSGGSFDVDGYTRVGRRFRQTTVSYTHLTLPTKRIV